MRKLSFEENLRHRLRDLRHIARQEPSSSAAEGILYLSIGAIAGVAAGMYIAQKYGGFGAITSRIREKVTKDFLEGYDADAYEEEEPGELDADDEPLTATEELEERVLEAFRHDPILCERAIDIGALDVGIIELTGWVHSPTESKHAVTIARGTPGVDTVLNRLAIRENEDSYDDRARRYSEGDASLTQGQWEAPEAPREAPPPRGD